VTEENSEEPQDKWSMGQDLNPGHPKYEAEVFHLYMMSGHFRIFNWNESIVFSGLSKCSAF